MYQEISPFWLVQTGIIPIQCELSELFILVFSHSSFLCHGILSHAYVVEQWRISLQIFKRSFIALPSACGFSSVNSSSRTLELSILFLYLVRLPQAVSWYNPSVYLICFYFFRYHSFVLSVFLDLKIVILHILHILSNFLLAYVGKEINPWCWDPFIIFSHF